MTRLLLALALTVVCLTSASAELLDAIKQKHRMDCGVVSEADDWNRTDVHGNLAPLGADICRAVAIAILGDTEGLAIRDYPSELDALAALKGNAVQLVAGISPDTTTATQYGLGFGPPFFYDAQRVMVHKASGITDLAGLRDRLVCTLDLTEPARTLHDELSSRGIPYAVMAHSEQGEMDAAIAVRRCAAGTGMESRLAQSRAGFHAYVEDFVFLPDRFALSPVVPAYRYGDPKFAMTVDWALYALVEAEALGITKANVAEAAKREDERAERLLGHDFATAQSLGLAHDWAAKVIAAVGNYAEAFDRDVGGPYRLERGPNRLWSDGGLMRPLPLQ